MDHYIIVFDTLTEGCYLRMLPDKRIHAFRSIEEAYNEYAAIEKIILNNERHCSNYEDALKNLRPCIIKAPADSKVLISFIPTDNNLPIFLTSSGIQFEVPVIKISTQILMFQEVDIADKILSKYRRY